MKRKLLLKNCRPITYPHTRSTTDILIENGIIKKVSHMNCAPDNCEIIDASNRSAAPGFIDVHIQGAGGADVLDGTEQALHTISSTCARFGVTGFLATTVFKKNGDNCHISNAARMVGKHLGGASLLGIHLEGPFISSTKRGMIQPDSICDPSPTVLEDVLEITGDALKIMTIAPELEHNLDIIRRLSKKGVIASIGHTNCSYHTALRGIE
ncbi:MAG: N-acetylglucosamine-6-phosphate deacetylase, partial [Spirochaetota bacterium]